MHMIILLRNNSLDRTASTSIPQPESDDNPYQALSLEYDSDTDDELIYPSQYSLLQYDLQTTNQVIAKTWSDLRKVTSDITKIPTDELLLYEYDSQEGHCHLHTDLSSKSNMKIIPWSKYFFVSPPQLHYIKVTDLNPICCMQIHDQLITGLLTLLVHVSSHLDKYTLFLETVLTLLEESAEHTILQQSYQRIFNTFLSIKDQQLTFFQLCIRIQSENLIVDLRYIYPYFSASVFRHQMRHADILLTPLPVCVVESVQQLQTLSKEHFPILLTASSKLFLVYDEDHQTVSS